MLYVYPCLYSVVNLCTNCVLCKYLATIMAPPSRPVFGQTIQKRKGGKSNYQRQFGGGGKTATVYRSGDDSTATEASKAAARAEYRCAKQARGEALDKWFGMEWFALDTTMAHTNSDQKLQRRGWLFNMLPTTVSQLRYSRQCYSLSLSRYIELTQSLCFIVSSLVPGYCFNRCFYSRNWRP
jgi:hypothetical protein